MKLGSILAGIRRLWIEAREPNSSTQSKKTSKQNNDDDIDEQLREVTFAGLARAVLSSVKSAAANKASSAASSTAQTLYPYVGKHAAAATISAGLLIGEAQDPEVLRQKIQELELEREEARKRGEEILRKKEAVRKQAANNPKRNRSHKNRVNQRDTAPAATPSKRSDSKKPQKIERKKLVLNMKNIESLTPSETATWILLRIEEERLHISERSNAHRLLIALAERSDIENVYDAAEIVHIPEPHVEGTITSFIASITGEPSLAALVTDKLIGEREAEVVSAKSEEPTIQTEDSSIQVSTEDLSTIESFIETSRLNRNDVRKFFMLNEENRTTMRAENLQRRIDLLHTFDLFDYMPTSNRDLLYEEVAFKKLERIDAGVPRVILEKAKELPRHSLLRSVSAKVDMITILDHYSDRQEQTLNFIDNLHELNRLGVYGAERLLQKAAKNHTYDDHVDTVCGLYNEATVTLELRKVLNLSSGTFTLSATDVSPNIDDVDLRIETKEGTFLIEIKTSAEYASTPRSNRQLTRLCNAAKDKRHRLGNDYIPVCLISRMGDDLTAVRNRDESYKELTEFFESVLSHEKTDDRFRIWSTSGQEMNQRIKTDIRGLRLYQNEHIA